MIVKCQRSVNGSGPEAHILFYNEDRTWLWEGPLTEEWRRHFGPTMSPDDSRFFALVRWTNKAQPPIFERRLPEQHW